MMSPSQKLTCQKGKHERAAHQDGAALPNVLLQAAAGRAGLDATSSISSRGSSTICAPSKEAALRRPLSDVCRSANSSNRLLMRSKGQRAGADPYPADR